MRHGGAASRRCGGNKTQRHSFEQFGDVMSKSKFQLQLMKTEWQDKLKDHVDISKQEFSIQEGRYVFLNSLNLP